MTASSGYDAVLLAGFGGPESPDEVLPFLERVTAGRGIPPERLLEVGQHYLTLGGVSPINEQNRALLGALQAELAGRGIDLPVMLGNRNSAPFFAEVVAELHRSGLRRILAIATSAYSSYSGCRQYREDLWQALDECGLTDEVEIRKIAPYGFLDGFTAPMADGMRHALDDVLARNGSFDGLHVFFTTHSIPDVMQDASGPGGTGAYLAQHRLVAERVVASATAGSDVTPDWSLVFQSRSGPPTVPWLEPDINDALRDAAARGVREVILVPIGFISDHIEVVWDLDTQARETAEGLGLGFTRIRTAGVDPRFVDGMADLIVGALGGQPPDLVDPWAGTCGTDCCISARSTREAVPPPPSTAAARVSQGVAE
jgi:ferrochelatase